MKFIFFTILIIWVLYKLVLRPGNVFFNMNANQDRKQNRREGEVNIDYVPSKEKKKSGDNDDGEYVDFEEIK